MPKTKSPRKAKGRAGKVFLSVEIDPELRQQLRIAAMTQHMHLKDWLPVFIRKHLSESGGASVLRG